MTFCKIQTRWRLFNLLSHILALIVKLSHSLGNVKPCQKMFVLANNCRHYADHGPMRVFEYIELWTVLLIRLWSPPYLLWLSGGHTLLLLSWWTRKTSLLTSQTYWSIPVDKWVKIRKEERDILWCCVPVETFRGRQDHATQVVPPSANHILIKIRFFRKHVSVDYPRKYSIFKPWPQFTTDTFEVVR